MKILLVKLSSIGDLIHTFPAIVDATSSIPNLTIDWVVDQAFIEVVKLQQLFSDLTRINRIIPIGLRSLKAHGFRHILNFPLKSFLDNLRSTKYDVIIDAQGLLKSAIIAKLAYGSKRFGFNLKSCKEPLASFLYSNKIAISKELHATTRLRELFAQALGYSHLPQISYGLEKKKFDLTIIPNLPKNLTNYIVLLHSTTWKTKHWDIESWFNLSTLITNQQINVVIMLHQPASQEFMTKIAQNPQIITLTNLNLIVAATVIANAKAVVGVDTGLTHLAGSLNVPTVGIYGPTAVTKAGVYSSNSINVQSSYHCAPCFARTCREYNQGKTTIKQPCLREITPQLILKHLHELKVF